VRGGALCYAMLCLLLARGAALRKVVVERDVIIVPEGPVAALCM
jgi:hypothetical protein